MKLILPFIFLCTNLFAQVGVSKVQNFLPDNNSIFDISSEDKGILIPRIALKAKNSLLPISPGSNIPNSLLVYNTATDGVIPNNVTPGFYYWENSMWNRLINKDNEAKPTLFYAPSLVLPTQATNSPYTINLYQQYLDQYTLQDNTTSTSSNTSSNLPTYLNTQLDYFVTYYDKDVFTNVKVSSAGVLTYTVRTEDEPKVSEKTYMNIVFKVKN